jgi:hypothetical protein
MAENNAGYAHLTYCLTANRDLVYVRCAVLYKYRPMGCPYKTQGFPSFPHKATFLPLSQKSTPGTSCSGF